MFAIACSPYSLNCYGGANLTFQKLCRITQSSSIHRTESVSVMGHELFHSGLATALAEGCLETLWTQLYLRWKILVK